MHPETESRELWVKAMKEAKVASVGPDDNDDMRATVDALHKGKVVATVQTRDVSRDQALQTAMILASGFAADELWLVLDSHMSNSAINPSTGEQWGPGEMQAGCEGEQMCSTGIITDCMMIVYGNRDGRRELTTLPYHVHKKERTIRWVDEEKVTLSPDEKESTHVSGFVIEGIDHAFDSRLASDIIREVADDDPGVFLNATKIARATAAELLARDGHTVLLSVDTEEEAADVQTFMSRGVLVREE